MMAPFHCSHFARIAPRFVGLLGRIDKDAKEQRKQRIFDLWLAGWTQQEIADSIGCDRLEVTRETDTYIPNGDIAELNKTQQSASDHATDFDPPIYNVWKQQTKQSRSISITN